MDGSAEAPEAKEKLQRRVQRKVGRRSGFFIVGERLGNHL